MPLPTFGTSVPGAIYLLGPVAGRRRRSRCRVRSALRLGAGLLAIHDDEDVAEVKGVPTFRYKLAAFAISRRSPARPGAIQAAYVGYVTVGDTFSITVPLYVVLMSILGGARHWAGPAVGATLITVALSLFVGGTRRARARRRGAGADRRDPGPAERRHAPACWRACASRSRVARVIKPVR